MITAARAIDEGIRHALNGSSPSSELDEIQLVNYAGRVLDRLQRWCWREERAVPLVLEEGESRVWLPRDIQQIRSIYSQSSAGRTIRMTSIERIHSLRSLGTSTIAPGSFEGAVVHEVPPPQNLLTYSEALNQTGAWVAGLGAAVTPSAAVNPFTGAQDVERVSDISASFLADLVQTIPVRYVPTGKYCLGITIRPNPLTTNPDRAAVSLETENPADSGLQSLMEITWGTEPARDPPTIWIDPAASGKGTVRVIKGEGEGFWTLAIEGHAHDVAKQLGRLKCRILPAIAAFNAPNGTLLEARTGAVEVARVWVHNGQRLGEYHETGSALVVPKAPRPALEIYPSPAELDPTDMTLFYRSAWSDVEDGSEFLAIPDWIEPLYIEVLRTLAKGWEEEDEGGFSARVTQIRRLDVFKQMAIADGLMQNTYGKPQGGIGRFRSRQSVWAGGWSGNGPLTGAF